MANEQDIEFSYNMGGMKIDIDALKKNAQMKKQQEKAQKKEQSKKEFEELKKKMEIGAREMPNKTPKNLTNNKYQSDSEKEVDPNDQEE